MRRLAVRAFMVLVGLSLLVVYVGVAFMAYRLLVVLWAARPSLPIAVATVALLTLGFGYLSYRFGTARILSNLDAARLPRERAPAVHELVDRLSERMDVDRPDVFVAGMATPNALALGGRGNGVLVLDAGLLRLLTAEQLEGIIAHELAHLESHDSLIQTLAYSTVRTLVGLVLLVLFPVLLIGGGIARAIAWIRGEPFSPTNLAARLRYRVSQGVVLLLLVLTIVVRAHSRRREYAADDRAIEVTGNPRALARALAKIKRASEPGWGLLSTLYTHGDEEGSLLRMLSTHPPMDERIDRLLDRAEENAREIPIS